MTLISSLVFAEGDGADIKLNGWGMFTCGRFGSGMNQKLELWGGEADTDFGKRWYSSFMAGLRMEKMLDDMTSVRIHIGVTTAFQIYDASMSGQGPDVEYQTRKFVPFLIEAAVGRKFEVSDQMSWVTEFGYLPLRYNPQAANLGEFLIRSMAYPTVVESGYEQADKVKVAGVHAGLKMNYGDKSFLKVDEYLFTETYIHPLFDISDALIATVNHENWFEIGAGVNLHNMISVNSRATTPSKDSSLSQRDYMWYIDPAVVNPLDKTDTLKWPDTTVYTTKSTKLMGRITINPLGILGMDEDGIFGPEDFKVYAEVAILGIKNYKGWYEKMVERMPIMFGINLPGFKFLDVISFQLQYLNNPYWNTYENYLKATQLIPYVGQRMPPSYKDYITDTLYEDTIKQRRHDDDWKWSLYMSKNVNKRVKFSLGFACDNIFKTSFMPPPPTIKKYTEIMGSTWMRDVTLVPKFDADGMPVLDPETGLQVIEKRLGKSQWGKIRDWYWMGSIMFMF